MKILFTGGGTGGHFYPIIAIAQELEKLIKENRLIDAELFFMSPTPYNAGILYDNGIKYVSNTAGKRRTYFSILNFFDMFKTAWGVLISLWKVFNLYPDVVFGKGGYASFPVLMAARALRIPVVIHESDSVPGRVNQWAGKFAERVAVSFSEAAKYFPESKVAHTGNPVRAELVQRTVEGAKEYFGLESNIKTILILGGSQGSKVINDAVIEALARLVKDYQILHQTGKDNVKQASETGDVVLLDSPLRSRYKTFDYFNTLQMRMAAGAADIIISRAGSTIFEIAAWGVPSIIIPIRESQNDHQAKNAFAYARAGACTVVQEENLSSNILVAEIARILGDPETARKMSEAASAFFKPDAARLIATEILRMALKHEQ